MHTTGADRTQSCAVAAPGGSWEEVRNMATSDSSPPVGGVRAYWIGSVVVSIAVWLGTGVALHGSGQFGKVLPIFVAGEPIGVGAGGLALRHPGCRLRGGL